MPYSDSQFFSDMGDMFQGTGDVAVPGVTEATIEANTYPVTRVYCDQYGIITYERSGYEPMLIASSSPKMSRVQALRTAKYVYDMCSRKENSTNSFESQLHRRSMLTARQFIEQTLAAAEMSKDIAAKLDAQVAAKLTSDERAQLKQVEEAPRIATAPSSSISRESSIKFLAENERYLAEKVQQCRNSGGKGVLLSIKENGDASTKIVSE